MGLADAVGLRTDPVLAYNFLVTLVDSSSTLALAVAPISNAPLGGFSECTGLEMSLKIEEFNEGGRNDTALKFPTRISWSNLTLKRGVAASTDLWDWHYAFVEGRGQRRDGIIVLQNDLHLPVSIWHFKRGLPVKWSGPAMHANQSNVAVETLEIAHEGLWQAPLVGQGASVIQAAGALIGG
jgi:phage tail-like protein